MAKVTKTAIGNKILAGRCINDVVKYPVNKDKNSDGCNYQCDRRTNNMPPEYFEVINEAHLRFGIFGSAYLFEERFSI